MSNSTAYDQAFSKLFVAKLASASFAETWFSDGEEPAEPNAMTKRLIARRAELERAVQDAEAELAKFPPPADPGDND